MSSTKYMAMFSSSFYFDDFRSASGIFRHGWWHQRVSCISCFHKIFVWWLTIHTDQVGIFFKFIFIYNYTYTHTYIYIIIDIISATATVCTINIPLFHQYPVQIPRFLLDMVVLQDAPALRPRVAEVIREALEAEQLYKVAAPINGRFSISFTLW